MKTTPNGLILIFHEGFATINEQECLKALPKEWHGIPTEKIKVNYTELVDLGDGHNLDFSQIALDHRRQFKDDIKPLLDKFRTYRVIYFGLVHIPLAVDFGSLFDDDRLIEIYNYDRKGGIWFQDLKKEGKTKEELNGISHSNLPDTDQKGLTSALIRLSVSYEVDDKDTEAILPNATEFDVRLSKTGLLAIDSRTKMQELGELVEGALTRFSENRSRLKEIHLFAAVPCGLAFLIGIKISKNNHLFVQTYQFKNTAETRYKKALLVKKKIKLERILTKEDKQNASRLRELAHDTLRGGVKDFAVKNKKDAKKTQWPADVIYFENDSLMESQLWNQLPSISATGIEEDVCSQEEENVREGFKRTNHTWHIDDQFLVALANRLQEETKIAQAFRQLFFSGILHAKKHNMGEGKDESIERFSKVLEIVDYQADVYAILNEYGFQDILQKGLDDNMGFFTEAIEILIQTLWSTDDMGTDLYQIPIRKFNRHLIWHWQLMLIKSSDGSTDQIIEILENKPVIELSGLRVREENGDFYYEFVKKVNEPLELAVFHKNEVIRKGATGNFSLDNLIKGFTSMRTERILEELIRFNP